MATTSEPFGGFSRAAIDFLAELAANNDRAWFQPRKGDYERLVKWPMEALCSTLGERFEARRIPLRSDPARSPFRIYRDTRFSKDKSPYKPYASASFPWAGDGGGPGGYFHFQPGEMYIGGGMWHPEPARLAAWRATVVGDPSAVHAAIADPGFAGTFGDVHGDSLKRVPPGFPADHPDAALLKLKDVTFGRRLSDDEALSPDLPDILADAFADAIPVIRLLAGLAG
jgi:uncharacterized protein (TIGR02453 family)